VQAQTLNPKPETQY